MFNKMHRLAVLLPSVFCILSGVAQTTLRERLSHVLEIQDMEMGLQLYNEITEADLNQLPDSSLFDYHYLGGYLNSEISNHDKAISHLLEAKKLCDTSLGTHTIGYMEIMYGLGDEYMELGQYYDALAVYQEGIVKSMFVRNGAPKAFGNLIMGVQECYEHKGWFNEISAHLLDAWGFWPKDEEPFATYNYFPLWSLEQFYFRYGMYEEALRTSDSILEFITTKVGDSHTAMADVLYMKGSILSKMHRENDAIDVYSQGLSILKKNKQDAVEIYGLISGNLLMILASMDRMIEAENILKEINGFSRRVKDPSIYHNALFSLSNILNERGHYSRALEYNSQLLGLDLSEEETKVIENQANSIQYNKEIIEGLSQLEKQFETCQKGSDEWFDTAHKLSSAYFIKKEHGKNDMILRSMYEVILSNPSNGDDYHFWTLMNLYGNCMDMERYAQAIKYAIEKSEYINSIPDAPELYRYNAINDIVAAKLRANCLDGIDNDLAKIEPYYLTKFGMQSNEYATYLHNRGRAYQLQNKFDEAKEAFLKSILIQNKLAGRPMERTVKYYMEVEQQLGEL